MAEEKRHETAGCGGREFTTTEGNFTDGVGQVVRPTPPVISEVAFCYDHCLTCGAVKEVDNVKEAEMPLVRAEKSSGNFFIMCKAPTNDDRLSWKAKGILAYLMSKPDNWQIWVNDLVKRSRDGRTAVLSALKELQECGYAIREQRKRADGTFGPVEYVIYEEPQSGFPLADKPQAEEPLTENPTYTNNDYTNNDISNNKETVLSSSKTTPEPTPVTEQPKTEPVTGKDYLDDLSAHFGDNGKKSRRERIRDALSGALGVPVPYDDWLVRRWDRGMDALVGEFRDIYGKKRIDDELMGNIIEAIGLAKLEDGWDMCKGPSEAVVSRIVAAGRSGIEKQRAGVDLAARQAAEQARVKEMARAHGHE